MVIDYVRYLFKYGVNMRTLWPKRS